MAWYVGDTETTYDAENENAWVWLWSICSVDNPDDIVYGYDGESLIHELEKHVGDRVYFHNLKYDGEFIFWLLDTMNYRWLPEDRRQYVKTYKTLITDDRQVYAIKISPEGRGYVELYDSLKVIMLPVRDIARAYGLPESKGDIDYEMLRPVGYRPTVEELDYIRRDVQIVALALQRFQDEGETAMTSASNAMRYYKNLLGGNDRFRKVYPVLDKPVDDFIRKSYRGGFTYVKKSIQGLDVYNGMVYDVNSLYPSVMYNEVMPYYDPVWYDGKPTKTEEYPLYIVNIDVWFTLKQDHIPTMQLKRNIKFGQTEYIEDSQGIINCTLTSVDLELLFEQYDIEYIRYNGGYRFHGSDAQFKEYIDYWTGIKVQAAKDGNKGLRSMAKLKLNSLYGKFASRMDGTTRKPVIEGDRLRYVLVEGEDRKPVYTAVGAFVTAYARAKTIRTAQSVYDRFCYADTDSIHITGTEPPDIDIDDYRLGAWKLESSFTRARFLRAKCYLEEIEGSNVVHVAGMPHNVHDQVTFDNFRLGAVYDDKLYTKHVHGGIILSRGEMELKP